MKHFDSRRRLHGLEARVTGTTLSRLLPFSRSRSGFFALSILISLAPVARAEAPATQPDAPELIRSKSDMAGYGAETDRLVNQKDEIVSVLRNGATVIVKRVPSPVVAVRGYVYTGGVYEGKWLGGGLSHLLEHLVAGGSNERRTEAENKNLLQRIGNDSNAYTAEDHTAYFVNTTRPHLEEAVDLVTGWMLGAKITVPEYRREYEVVQRELERGKGQPDSVFWDIYLSNRYHVSPARVPVIGYQEVIQGLSRDDVYSYYKLAYQPNNMVFAVAGDVEPEAMLAAVRKHVSDAKPGRVFSRDIAPEPPVLAPRTVVGTFPRLGPARVDLSFPTVRIDSPDMYALDLLGAALGGGESSILVQDLRDKQQLVSGISCADWTPAFVDGAIQLDFQADPDKVAAATKAALAVVQDARDHGVDDARLARARTQMKMARLKAMQTSENVAASLATDFMSTADPHFSDRYVDRVEKVTAEQVRDAARKYLDPGKLVTTVLLPSEYVGAAGLPRAEDLIRPADPTTRGAPGETSGAEHIQRMVLDNGTVLLLKRFTTTPLVTVQMYAAGGVTAEDAATNGLGNLTMASLPRGTATRSAEQIATALDSIGGDVETTCGNNSWSWKLSCSRDDLPKAMQLYADVVLHPAFADAEAAEMKRRLAAQIAGQDADWHELAFRFFKKSYYGPSGSPYQFMAVGTAANVGKFTPGQMRQWYTEKVLTAPRVLAIFGDVDPEQAKSMANDLLGGGAKLPAPPDRPQAAATTRPADDSTPSLDVARVEVQKTEQGPAGIVIGFKSQSVAGDPWTYPAVRAYTLAGGYSYPTGYIFETLRGLGLVYEAAAYDSPGRSEKTPGAFIAYAGCDPKNVNRCVDLMLLNIARLQGKPQDLQPDWFDRSRTLITTSDALSNETPAAQAEQAALDELTGLGYDNHQKFAARVEAVALSDVQAYARVKLRECVVTVCTPDPAAVKVATGKREYTSFPTVDLTPKGIQLDSGAPR